ncbi:riboflavin synthase [Flavobacteriaceae bacterium]|jgi:riboflavin synthase|nr:riboflavin synthase subunit alpha [uncultured bacterium]MDA9341743.1 riboflavin synthase [Flavobacteriaceae bacterium]MDB9994205.1 riboflavin synthase [Flavobacteriaceae bacterium]
MFTGIIESMGEIISLTSEGSNVHIEVKSKITHELKIDQSLAHNGVCLTVVEINGNNYIVTAIKETLDKSNIGDLKVGNLVNLERSMKLQERLDGHIVQGHVDQTAICTNILKEKGSAYYTFQYEDTYSNVTIEKGSVTVNGVSLTVVNSKENEFSVAIIPYTVAHTNFKEFETGTKVNLEFDVIGKYIKRLTQGY